MTEAAPNSVPTPARPTRRSGPKLFDPEHRALVIGLTLTITLVAFESLAVATVMPEVKDDLGGLGLYGWVFSGFFLGSLAGIIAAGRLADRRGLRTPYTAGLLIFAAGLLIGAEARSMPMLIVGRVLQGFGAGAIPAMGYTAIARGLPPALRPRMFAALSTAWVLPGLVGPAIATGIAHATSWRWVFGTLIPLVAVAGVMTVPALTALDRRRPIVKPKPFDRQRLRLVAALIGGVGAALAAPDAAKALAPVLLVVGVPLAVVAYHHLQPDGTLRLAAGVPATVAVRGLLTLAFFSGDAYVPLALKDGRGTESWVAGLALTAGALGWSMGSWGQARLIVEHGPRRLVGVGTAVFTSGSLLMLLTMGGLPVALAIVAWGIAASGIGLSYAPLSVTVLGAAPEGEEGSASAALQLSDTLGIALGSGIGGAIVALGDSHRWAVASSTTWVFAFSVAAGVAVHAASRRLPRILPGR